MEKTGKNTVKQRKRFDAMKVLIVDRDEITANYAARAFHRLGIAYEFAKDAKLAIHMLEEAAASGTGYDICLLNCDVDRADMDDTLFRIRSGHSYERPALACAFPRGSDCGQAVRESGGDYYIEQPILQSELYRMMTELGGVRSFAGKSGAKLN